MIKTPTPFQVLVWKEIAKIPKGKTISYKQLAINIGHPKAYRAVANACHINPRPIIVPCHRVIKSDGTIGGYRFGVAKKRALLLKETVKI
ncbi:MAG: MGMT family protein [Mycoplasmataceae bacterium]|jgi:AraC family transcriptional regulator of adaptative response/methylated-DNA-[protein]-cysteine methyltransferase|nr:MGMT family protein [Mycoplasmataceae bacterium]